MDRTLGIGGSDIAALMDISPWNTAFSVYQDKIGESKPVHKKQFEFGHKAQSPVLRMYEKHTDSVIQAKDVEIIHPDYLFLIGHLDATTNDGKMDTQQGMGDNAAVKDEERITLVTYKPHNKTSFDSTKFKEDHSELYSPYLKQTTCRPFKLI